MLEKRENKNSSNNINNKFAFATSLEDRTTHKVAKSRRGEEDQRGD